MPGPFVDEAVPSVDVGSTSPLGTPSGGRSRAFWLTLLAPIVLLAVVGYFAVRWWLSPSAPELIRPSGIPVALSTATADLMEISPVPKQPAPNFTLIDQDGRTMSLSGFRGRPVVLEFMDPHCTDICPIVSKEFVDAYHDLGRRGTDVAFVAVNVNQYHAAPGDMAAYSREQGLDSIPTWHFFTGPLTSLEAVWQKYGVYVEAPNPNADIVHTSIVYFIDSAGRERYAAVPMDNHAANGTAYLPASQVSAWGQGISTVVSGLLTQ
ncbi:MAG: SCO family protein [Acidimicrobiales bacterium]